MRFIPIALALLSNLAHINAVNFKYTAKQVDRMVPSDEGAVRAHSDHAADAIIKARRPFNAVKPVMPNRGTSKKEAIAYDKKKEAYDKKKEAYDKKTDEYDRKRDHHIKEAYKAAQYENKSVSLELDPTKRTLSQLERIYTNHADHHRSEAARYRELEGELKKKFNDGSVGRVELTRAIAGAARAPVLAKLHEDEANRCSTKAAAAGDVEAQEAESAALSLVAASQADKGSSSGSKRTSGGGNGEGSSKRMKKKPRR